MNIFFLDRDVSACAKMHCDKHVVKMIVESAQLLSTALREHGIKDETLYKSTHKNHPSAVWARKSKEHYVFLFELFKELCFEYTNRYNKIHASERLMFQLESGAALIPSNGWVDPPQCMPDECKRDDVVEAYRQYYKEHKRSFATWRTIEPDWWA